jgi:hypothetical protein
VPELAVAVPASAAVPQLRLATTAAAVQATNAAVRLSKSGQLRLRRQASCHLAAATAVGRVPARYRGTPVVLRYVIHHGYLIIILSSLLLLV